MKVAVVVASNGEPKRVVEENIASLLNQTVKADVFIVGVVDEVPDGVTYIHADVVKGAAQRIAMRELADEYDTLVFLDGDYKYPHDVVERLILPLKFSDIAYSSISQAFLPMAWAARTSTIREIANAYPDVDEPHLVKPLFAGRGMPASIPFRVTPLRGGRSPAWKKYLG